MIKNLLFLGSLLIGSYGTAQTTTIFEETFASSETHALWTIGDLDGDNDTWELVNDEDAVDAEVLSFEGGFAWSWSWFYEVLTPDNILTSPIISLPENGNIDFSFKVAAAADDEGSFEEHYAVYVIPAGAEFTGNETPIFEETLDAGYSTEGKLVNLDITEYAGQNVQLVFRHYDCEDILYVGIDDVKVEFTPELSTSDLTKEKAVVYQNQKVVEIKGLENVNEVRVFDLTGKKVSHVKGQSVDVSTLPKGIYIVNFHNDKEVVSRKITVK